jgi:hypothetical protein
MASKKDRMRITYDVCSPDAQYPGFSERRTFKSRFQALYHAKIIRRYGHTAFFVAVGCTVALLGSILLNPMRAMGEPPLSWYASMGVNRGNPAILGL